MQDAQTNTQTLMFTHFIATEPILLVHTYSSSAASLVGVIEQYWWRWGATKPLWIRAFHIYSPSHSLDEPFVQHDLFVEQLFVPVMLHRLILLSIYLSNTHTHIFFLYFNDVAHHFVQTKVVAVIRHPQKMVRHWAVENWTVKQLIYFSFRSTYWWALRQV